MTTAQLLALGLLGAVTLFSYVLPNLPKGLVKWPSVGPAAPQPPSLSSLKSIEHVILIRDSFADKRVADACNALLQALIQVSK